MSHDTPPVMWLGGRPDTATSLRASFRSSLYHTVDDDTANDVETFLASLQPVPSPALAVVDARVDDFESETDPNFTGWHRLEYLLFAQGTLDGAEEFADKLDADLAELKEGFPDLEIPAATLAVGSSELVEEVSLGKITGEENRYAKTDLWDIEANLDGSVAALDALESALEASDPALLASIRSSFDDVYATLKPLRAGDGWKPYCLPNDEYPSDRCPQPTLTQDQVDTLQAQLAALSEQTSQIAGALDLA